LRTDTGLAKHQPLFYLAFPFLQASVYAEKPQKDIYNFIGKAGAIFGAGTVVRYDLVVKSATREIWS
jgi:hypothetical protein